VFSISHCRFAVRLGCVKLSAVFSLIDFPSLVGWWLVQAAWSNMVVDYIPLAEMLKVSFEVVKVNKVWL
jgi:hypothetical protein